MHNINEPFFTLFVFLCWIFETYFFERYQTIRLYIYYIKHVPYFTTYVILFSYFFLETKYFIHIKKSTKSKITKIFIMFLTGIKIPIMSKLFNMQLPNGRSSLAKIGTQLIVRKLKKQKQKKNRKKQNQSLLTCAVFRESLFLEQGWKWNLENFEKECAYGLLRTKEVPPQE